MEASPIAHVQINRVSRSQTTQVTDQLAVEEPLEIRLQFVVDGRAQTKTISVTMRTPGNDAALAAGFLFTEGIINDKAQLDKVEHLAFESNIVIATLKENIVPNLNTSERNFYTTSSCGVCGKSSIDAIKTVSIYQQKGQDSLRVNASILYGLQEKLMAQQEVFESTGGLHASAYFDVAGNFKMLREDVGRHNALDKLIGTALLQDELPLANGILLLSGRASFELIQKATMAGIKLVVAVGAPSSLAVQLANECGITLVGFLKPDRFNSYTHSERIVIED